MAMTLLISALFVAAESFTFAPLAAHRGVTKQDLTSKHQRPLDGMDACVRESRAVCESALGAPILSSWRHRPPAMSPLAQVARTAFGTAVAYKVASGGFERGSLSSGGAAAAFVVAAVAFSCSFRSGVTLLAFYKTGSALTKVGASVKTELEEGYTEGGQRGARQVCRAEDGSARRRVSHRRCFHS